MTRALLRELLGAELGAGRAVRRADLHAMPDLHLRTNIRLKPSAWNCTSLPLLPGQAMGCGRHARGAHFARICCRVLFLEELAAARALDDRVRHLFFVAEGRQSLAILNSAELNSSPLMFQLLLVFGRNRLKLTHGLL